MFGGTGPGTSNTQKLHSFSLLMWVRVAGAGLGDAGGQNTTEPSYAPAAGCWPSVLSPPRNWLDWARPWAAPATVLWPGPATVS